MQFFDIRTIFVISAMFTLLYGFCMMAFARKMSHSFNGIYLFALNNFLIAIGLSLIFFRDYIDIVWSIIVANSLLLLAANFVYHAHLQFIGYKKLPVFLSAFALITVIVLFLVFTYIIPNTNTRSVISSTFYSLQFFLTAWTVWRFQRQTQQTIYTPLIVIAGIFGVFFCCRIIITLLNEQIDPYKLIYNPLQVLVIIFMMLYVATLDFFVVLISSGQLVQKVAELAYKDSLTLLYNRRGLDHTLEDNDILEKPLAVIMCDIDYFKAINDRYGHHTGDLVLQSFAKLLKDTTRKTDICTRWGGEEFLILLPLTNESEALTITEKIRVACTQLTFPEHPELSFTNSFGICCKNNNHSLDELIDNADHALYQAKVEGRNRVCVFNKQTGI
jgi:diguanylate cyclase (GGDEF)-like protein